MINKPLGEWTNEELDRAEQAYTGDPYISVIQSEIRRRERREAAKQVRLGLIFAAASAVASAVAAIAAMIAVISR